MFQSITAQYPIEAEMLKRKLVCISAYKVGVRSYPFGPSQPYKRRIQTNLASNIDLF